MKNIQTERLEVSDKIYDDIMDSIQDKSLVEVMDYLLDLKEQSLKDGYYNTKLELYHEDDRDYYGRSFCTLALHLWGIRLESDKEYDTRIKRSEAAREASKARKRREKEDREANERETYERLKAKFDSVPE